MEKVFIVDAKRTAIGKFNGTLRNINCGVLGSNVLKVILEKNGICSSEIDEVIVGNVLSAGQGQGVARQVQILSGIPVDVCAYSVNMVCGSSMKAVINGAETIMAGNKNCVVAGGVENMSLSPYLVSSNVRRGVKMGDFNLMDGMIFDSLTDAFSGEHMGITAENIAERYNISREEQDEYAFESQKKAIEAIGQGLFEREIVPIEVIEKKETIIFREDEYPNRNTSVEKLKSLRPAFKKGGTVTAGNASGINDGAAMLLLASEQYVKSHDLETMGEIVSFAQMGTDPAYMGMGPFYAVKKLVEQTDISFEKIGLFELNEAFAAQSLAVVKELAKYFEVTENDMLEKTNVNGGSIALGHPVGASGARIIVTLLHAMQERNIEYGIASLCIGGGMGTAVLIRNLQYKN